MLMCNNGVQWGQWQIKVKAISLLGPYVLMHLVVVLLVVVVLFDYYFFFWWGGRLFVSFLKNKTSPSTFQNLSPKLIH